MINYMINTDINQRKVKAINERFYLLEVSNPCVNSNDIVCKILNAKNKEYTIRIFNWTDDLTRFIVCSCPDASIGDNICKHIYWLGLKKIGVINPADWTPLLIKIFFERYELPNSSMPGKNTNCAICLEDINHYYQPTIRCLKGCDNSVHTKCWTKYTIISNDFTQRCVYCRQFTMPKWVSYKCPVYSD